MKCVACVTLERMQNIFLKVSNWWRNSEDVASSVLKRIYSLYLFSLS